ncbi:MAG: hypothetical protein MUF87_21370 [Anaerolineae bacterium]|jgi:hypothetical protein|nr:hypothetical protein [Anaerolineae bacterium]
MSLDLTETRWLYPQNVTFIDQRRVIHEDEIRQNVALRVPSERALVLTLIACTLLGSGLIAFGLRRLLITWSEITQLWGNPIPTGWAIGQLLLVILAFVLLYLGVDFVRAAMRLVTLFPFRGIKTQVYERLLARGRLTIGQVTQVVPQLNDQTMIHFTFKNRRNQETKGLFLTQSPILLTPESSVCVLYSEFAAVLL